MGQPFFHPDHERLAEALVQGLRKGPWTYPYSPTDEFTDARPILQEILEQLGVDAPLVDPPLIPADAIRKRRRGVRYIEVTELPFPRDGQEQ